MIIRQPPRHQRDRWLCFGVCHDHPTARPPTKGIAGSLFQSAKETAESPHPGRQNADRALPPGKSGQTTQAEGKIWMHRPEGFAGTFRTEGTAFTDRQRQLDHAPLQATPSRRGLSATRLISNFQLLLVSVSFHGPVQT